MKYSNSNWNLYRCFLVVYETRNLHRAAEVLGLTRSTVGSNIQALGDQIGAKLFTSGRKGVEPTSEAITLYPSIKKAVDLIIESEENIQEFNRDTKAVIRMAVFSTFASYYLHKYLKEFCERYPNVRFEFLGREGYELLSQKKIDFIIDFDHFFKQYDFKTRELCTISGIFITSKEFLIKHGLSETISKETLLSLPIISHRSLWIDLVNEVELPIDIFMHTVSTELAHSMARNGFGVAYSHKEFLNEINNSGIVQLKIEDVNLPVKRISCGYYSHQLTKPAKVFIDGLVKFLSSPNNSHNETSVF